MNKAVLYSCLALAALTTPAQGYVPKPVEPEQNEDERRRLLDSAEQKRLRKLARNRRTNG
jgi:hypothetical protein